MYFFGDSFDFYSAVADPVAGGTYWDGTSVTANASLATGRWPLSQAWQPTNGNILNKTSGQNNNNHHFNCSFSTTTVPTGATLSCYFTLYDGATAQCSIVFRGDGAIVFTSGAFNGTVLGTYNGAWLAANLWYGYEFEVVIGTGTNGSFAVRKNGNNVNDFAITGLNTAPSGVAQAGIWRIGCNSGLAQSFDDVLWRADTIAVPWLGEVRSYTRWPISDQAVQFSRAGAFAPFLVHGVTGITNSFGPNVALYIPFVAPYSGNLTGVVVDCNTAGAGGTGNVKAALFTNTAQNNVGTLIATSNVVTNPVASSTPLLTFATPGYVVRGTQYWIGINSDAAISYRVLNSAGVSLTQTYASWPVSNPAPGVVASNINSMGLTVNIGPAFNSDAVGETNQDGGNTYVYSSTIGQTDLYGLGPTPSGTPQTVAGVVTREFCEKTDAGTRNLSMNIKSGATNSAGPSVALNTSWGWVYRTDLVDPATSAAWTAAAVNALQVGPGLIA